MYFIKLHRRIVLNALANVFVSFQGVFDRNINKIHSPESPTNSINECVHKYSCCACALCRVFATLFHFT